ncbi:MAG: tetratricopeptide repeat protein [Treponema sp.]|nr:tetratricopeptide repeat protein [Treponema sp.]
MKTSSLKFFICLFLLFSTGLLCFSADRKTSKNDLYVMAPSFARKRIKKADSLIASKKYKSAWEALGSDDSDYIIAKKVDVCTQYFANTEAHTSFAFKDLKKGEDLNEVRLNPGKLDMFPYDVEKIVQQYEAQNGSSPRICYALGTYYYEVLLLFGDRWTKPEAETRTLARDNLKKAVDSDFYDARAAQRYANLRMEEGRYDEAEIYYAKSISLDDTNANALYNYALSLMSLGKYDEGIEPAKKAAAAYKDNKEFQLDAYILVAEAYMCLQNFNQAKKELTKLKADFPDSYLPDMKLGDIYSAENKISEASESYLNSFKKNPKNLQWFYQILGMYVHSNCMQEAFDLCNSAIKEFKGKSSTLGYLYTFLANLHIEAKNFDEALPAIDAAEKSFDAAGITNLKESLEQMRQACRK